MRGKFILILFLLVLPFWAATGWAEGPADSKDTQSGWYVSGSVGLSLHVDSDLEGAPGTNAGKLSFDPSPLLGGAVGFRFDKLFRVEGELTYRGFDADQVEAMGTLSPATGEATLFSFMVNGYRHIPTQSSWSPYLGVGFGGANVSWKDVASPATVRIDHSDLVFAFQFMAGVAYPLTPSFSLTGGYRLFGTSDPKFTAADNTVTTGEVIIHDFTLGAIYSF